VAGTVVSEVAERLAGVRDRNQAAGGDHAAITLVAVSKGQPHESLVAARAAGLLDFGESYAQELDEKVDVLDAQVRWHFIGNLQRNKVRLIAPFVHLWQSVDRLSLAGEIARRAPGAQVLVQVNVTGLEQQGGCPPERTLAVVDGCRDLGLDVRGLMAIGPQGSVDDSRRAFARVRGLVDQHGLAACSMGMSGDLEAAVAEGATIVRVGSDLFGPRPSTKGVGK
jgi:pyridoxal phosphate enzyme (YggS family)